MVNKIPITGWRWRIAHFILYLLKDDHRYWGFHVPLSDRGGSLIDLHDWGSVDDGFAEGPPYTREEVIRMTRAIGHTEEQITAALFLADVYDLADHHDMAAMGDDDYERLLKNAKQRLASGRKRAAKMKHGINPNS